LPILGDCKSVLQQLYEAVDAKTADRFQPWRQKLACGEAKKRLGAGGNTTDYGARAATAHFFEPRAQSGRRAN
jgi:hypothetical protein